MDLTFQRDKWLHLLLAGMAWLLITVKVVHGTETPEPPFGNDGKDPTIDKLSPLDRLRESPPGNAKKKEQIEKRDRNSETFLEEMQKRSPVEPSMDLNKRRDRITRSPLPWNPYKQGSFGKELQGRPAYPQNYPMERMGICPRENSLWHSPDGNVYRLGEYLGSGRYANVYRLKDNKEQVIKIYRSSNTKMDVSTLKRIEIGDSLLKRYNIQQLPILKISHYGSYIIQPALTNDMMVYSSTADWFMNASQNKQEAVVELYTRLSQAGVVWEDGHLGNLFFQREGHNWVAGILDQDLIWERFNITQTIDSTRNVVFLNEQMLYKRWISHDVDRNNLLRGSALNIHLVRAYFPNIERHLDKA